MSLKPKPQKRIMSGMRPTGKLHIGHYLGVIKNWIELQDSYECYFSIADWHALTTKFNDTRDFKDNIVNVAIDWLASGIDPEKSTIYLQSLVPETAELFIYLSMITPMNLALDNPTLTQKLYLSQEVNAEKYKDLDISNRLKNKIINMEKFEQGKKNISYGFLGYPVLQTADILTFNADLVPIGKDQLAHLEISRDIARKFNHIYKKDYFNRPQPKLTDIPLLKGIDGQKMGKSDNNDIKISDSNEITSKKIMKAVTDKTRLKVTDPGHPDLCEVICPYYDIFADKKTASEAKDKCINAKWGCADCKRNLSEIVNNYFYDVRAKRTELENNKDYVEQIIKEGSLKAQEEASIILKDVKKITKMF